MAMHKAAIALIAYVVVVLALLAGTYGPTAARDMDALLSPSAQATELAPAAPTTQAVCTTDLDCEQYALRTGMDTVPTVSDDDELLCPRGMEAYDTEMPELGAQGVVCRTHLMEV